MKKLYIILTVVSLAALLSSCGETVERTSGGGSTPPGTEAIILSGNNAETTSSRAAEGFPNDGRIGVIAAYYDPGDTDWRSYPDIDDAPATATTVNGGIYGFTWDQQKYWPLDNGRLVFMAYSPVVSENTGSMSLSPDRTRINLELADPMPDVMYASGNGNAENVPYSKISPVTAPVVDLGEFRHALSQLTIEVVADPTMNPNVRVSYLRVRSYVTTGFLNLQDDTGAIGTGAGDFSYVITTTDQRFDNEDYINTVLLFPETESNIQVDITLHDGIYSVSQSVTLANVPSDGAGTNLTLEPGVNTKVRFLVKGTQVLEPDDEIHLSGSLTPWVNKGNFGVTIN